jgi:hypothetical protein
MFIFFFACPKKKRTETSEALGEDDVSLEKKKGQKALRAFCHRCFAKKRCSLINVHGLFIRCPQY